MMKYLAAGVAVTACAVSAIVVGTSAGAAPAGAAAPIVVNQRVVTDPSGDTEFAWSDIQRAEMSAADDGTVTATLVVREWTDPEADDWTGGETAATWEIDTDGDGEPNGRVRLDAADGELRAGVLGRRNRVRCLGEPSAIAAQRAYRVTFSAACLGNPEQLRFRAEFAYDDVTFDIAESDIGPDTGWSASLVNPAYIGPLVTVDPERLYDSREGAGRRTAGSVTELTVTGVGGVPDDAIAVLLNVTAVRPGARGFVTVTPCGFPRATTSNLNYQPGRNVANAVLARVGIGDAVCFYTESEIDLVIDVNGYVPALSDVGSVPPARIVDTRESGEMPAAGSVLEVPVTDRYGVPADAAGVVLNVTAVRPATRGFMTVYPCGGDTPLASNLNFNAGDNVPNAVVARVGASGTVCVFTSTAAHIIVDVNGFLPEATAVQPLDPVRLYDSRDLGDRLAPGTVTPIPVTGEAGVAATASGVILNVTAVRPDVRGFLTVFPCGGAVPTTSNVNYVPNSNVPNAVVARVGAGGAVCIFNSTTVHVLVDVNGFVP